MKNVFTLPADKPFLDVLAAELWNRTQGDGFLLSKHLILLPTRRACRSLGAAFAKVSEGKPVLLPRIRPLGDVDEDEMAFVDQDFFDEPPALSPLKRQMMLAQLVKKRDPDMTWDQALLAAESLARFLDQVQIEQGDLSKLESLVDRQDLASHWQQTLDFLEIIIKHWPLMLAEQGCQDPIMRRNAVMRKQVDIWRKTPPNFPVLAAGSTGSVPATAALLDAIADMPQGAVILPGLDREIDNEAWQDIGETHPQHSMKALLERMGLDRKNVRDFAKVSSAPSPRAKLLSEAMRPASSTDTWRELKGKLDPSAVEGFSALTLDHPQEEAQVIALRLRAFLETPEKTAAFVTADRALAERVATLLRRWGLSVDDSGGKPLAHTPVGAFLDLALAAASPYAETVDRLALLKHPFAACGLTRAACLSKAREAEVAARRLEGDRFDFLRILLEPLSSLWSKPLPLAERISLHVHIAEILATTDTEKGADRLWRGEDGLAADEGLNDWQVEARDFPSIGGEDYLALFRSISSRKTLRSTRDAHPRLSILGPLEARMCDADLIVLGGLNEGSWPPDVGYDPWMSRPMRKRFNLPLPEYRIGLSAHDFAQLCCAKNVFLTRSTRVNGVPTVASRFLLQLETVLKASGLSNGDKSVLEASPDWRIWAQALDRPEAIASCARPRPCPPVEVRPKALSVTEISTWLRNPYAIYAKHILNLHKLDPLDAELDASDRGTMIHEILEKFVRAFPDYLPSDVRERLGLMAREVFSRVYENARVRAFWESGFEKIADWFLTQEYARRATEVRSLRVEAAGQIVLDGFTLKGRADRVETLLDGSLRLIDYKTGAVPKSAEVLSGLEPQLALLALIASTSGFKDLPASPVSACEYWALKVGNSACKITGYREKLEDLVPEAEAGLRRLIAIFERPETIYYPTPRPRFSPHYDDYAHLARSLEWGRTGDAS